MKKKFLIAGGDLRFVKLAEFLKENGCFVNTIGFDNGIPASGGIHNIKNLISLNEKTDCLILPLPVSIDGENVNCPYSDIKLSAETLAAAVSENGIVFGGRFPDGLKEKLHKRGLTVIDYSEREEFAVMNAEATAEGALQAAMEETDRTIMGQRILIIGMGRIAKALIHILQGFNADITAAARKYSDRSWAEIYGCRTADITALDKELERATIVFNTVPVPLLDERLLKKINKDCPVIDLASKPGGVDFESAARIGVRTLWLLSLPGKAAPTTAGITIGKTILNILEERGEGIV
ncbi:MAG: dipicolinate synthase subunit DpsA [Oscillospiraceae bacterium]